MADHVWKRYIKCGIVFTHSDSLDNVEWHLRMMRWYLTGRTWSGYWTWVRFDWETQDRIQRQAVDRAIASSAGACLPPEMLVHIAVCACMLSQDKGLYSIVLVCREWRRRCLPFFASEIKIDVARLASFAQFARQPMSSNFAPLVTDLTLRGASTTLHRHPMMLVSTLHCLEESIGTALRSLHMTNIYLMWPHPTYIPVRLRRLTALRKLELCLIRFDSTTVLLRLLASLPSLEKVEMVDSDCGKTVSTVPSKRATHRPLTVTIDVSTSPGGKVWPSVLSLCWTWPVSALQDIPRFSGLRHAEAQAVSSILAMPHNWLPRTRLSLQLQHVYPRSCMFHVCVILAFVTDD